MHSSVTTSSNFKTQAMSLKCISLGKILIRILNPKPDFLFLWKNPKEDYKNNESIRDEDSIYQFESGFLGFTTFLFLWERIRKKSMW